MKKLVAAGLSLVVIITILLVSLWPSGPGVTSLGRGMLSLSVNNIVLAAKQLSPAIQPTTQQIGDTVEQTSWGYRYVLGSGDIVEVGDSTTTDFKASLKTIRGDKWFSLGLAGGTFTPTLNGLTISFSFNNNIDVSIYPVDPSERLPDGGIEYDVTLKRRVAQSTVDFIVDWSGITWQKIYGLDIEYNEAKCEERFGIEAAPYTITPTTITGSDSVIYLTRPEYEINSYLGTAISPTVTTSDYGTNPNNGQPMTYSNISRTNLYIHRGQMTDALGNKAWVEDINLNEAQKTLTFSLPSTWLKNATYPVRGVCGVDPAYTEDMDSWQSTSWGGSDGVWGNYDIFTNKSVPKGAVAEIILSNSTTGTENTLGVRTDGGGSERKVTLHEAEGGGQTHCRMFVLVDASTGLIECYHSDVSDADYFYLVGYWQNVSFTEKFEVRQAYSTNDTWGVIFCSNNGKGQVWHMLLENAEQDVANTIGVRSNGSSLERKLLVHEPEAGGSNLLDMLVKTDASGYYKGYTSDKLNAGAIPAGYFGTELDFVEKWEDISSLFGSWADMDLSTYLDQDGRVCDFLLTHGLPSTVVTMGVRSGDDTSTLRYLAEHEAEPAVSTAEYTGFGMSATSNSSGIVHGYNDYGGYQHLTGYFKPSSAVNISLSTPKTRTLMSSSVVQQSSTYYTYSGSTTAPTWPLTDGECYFYVSNDGTVATDIYVHGHNFTGGVGWTLTSDSPGSNQVRVTWFDSGDGSGDGTVVTTSDQQVLDELAASAHEHFDFKAETGTFTDGVAKSGVLTISGVID